MFSGAIRLGEQRGYDVGDGQALSISNAVVTTVISCRKCRSPIPLEVAVVRMGGAQLFVCPCCHHQEVWRPVP